MMAAGDRQVGVDDYVKNKIKILSESDIRDRMKAHFDKRIEKSECFLSISNALDKTTDCPCSTKGYNELLSGIGGSTTAADPDTIDPVKTGTVQQISAELLHSENLRTMKEDLFREWDLLRLEKRKEVELLEHGLVDKQLVTMTF